MYKSADKTQTSLLDFNQPMGLRVNPNNRWIQTAHKIPWDQFEGKYAELFPSDTGNVAKSLRMALGSLIIQDWFQPRQGTSGADHRESVFPVFYRTARISRYSAV